MDLSYPLKLQMSARRDELVLNKGLMDWIRQAVARARESANRGPSQLHLAMAADDPDQLTGKITRTPSRCWPSSTQCPTSGTR